MNTTVKKYRLYCQTEEAFREVWSTSTPTVCPSGIEHSIDEDTIVVIDRITSDIIKAEIVDSNDPTEGFFKTQFYTIQTSTSGWSELEVSWDVPISLLFGEFSTCEKLVGDEVEILYVVGGPIGYVTSPVLSGSSVISGSDTVLANISAGLKIKLNDGVNEDDLGQILSFDLDNLTFTCENSLQHDFGISPLTYVYLYGDLLGRSTIGGCGKYNMTRGNLKSKTVPVTDKIVIRYHNKDGEDKSFCLFAGWTY